MLWHQNSCAKPMPLNSGVTAFLNGNADGCFHYFADVAKSLTSYAKAVLGQQTSGQMSGKNDTSKAGAGICGVFGCNKDLLKHILLRIRWIVGLRYVGRTFGFGFGISTLMDQCG
ncbi:hypothetical protein Tco_1064678 [Tanacetum coccineum]